MKTIGILGGMSAASTRLYYDMLCDLAQARFGGLTSPQLLIRSLDFAPIADAQARGDWDALGDLLAQKARALEAGGAEILVLATNTMHKCADTIAGAISIPFLHLADATALDIARAGFRRPGLMATAFTMEQDFYTGRLAAHGLTPVVPNAQDRADTHRIIYDELCKNVVSAPSQVKYIEIAQRLAADGADCLILGCTEVGMLLNAANAPIPVFDTTHIHCKAAFAAAIGEQDEAG